MLSIVCTPAGPNVRGEAPYRSLGRRAVRHGAHIVVWPRPQFGIRRRMPFLLWLGLHGRDCGF